MLWTFRREENKGKDNNRRRQAARGGGGRRKAEGSSIEEIRALRIEKVCMQEIQECCTLTEETCENSSHQTQMDSCCFCQTIHLMKRLLMTYTVVFMQAGMYRESGMEPYAYTFARTHLSAELQEQHRDLADGEVWNALLGPGIGRNACAAWPHLSKLPLSHRFQENNDIAVSVAGRIVARRVMGKLAFLSLKDDSGTIQAWMRIPMFIFKA